MRSDHGGRAPFRAIQSRGCIAGVLGPLPRVSPRRPAPQRGHLAPKPRDLQPVMVRRMAQPSRRPSQAGGRSTGPVCVPLAQICGTLVPRVAAGLGDRRPVERREGSSRERGLLHRGAGADPVRRPRLDRPARVQGLRARPARPRQADGGPPPARASASGTRSPGPAATCSASARSTGRGSAPPATRWPPRGRRWPSRSSSSPSSACRTTASTTATSRPRAAAFAEFRANLDALVDDAEGYQERTGVRLLWGTANLFTHPRYQAGAATNPDPEVFAYAAAQVKHMLEVTQRLGGENYVLWGGREGYDTLLNTDLRREGDQLARFLHLVAEHKHKIGFKGQLLIEPKPMEPTKHQYDYDTATVHGFLVEHGLEGEYRVNIEANHATLAGHSFHHEVAYAIANGMLGSIDANRGDPQNGWDTDQFPNSVEDLVAADLRDPARRRHRARRLQLRRQAAPPEHRPRPTCSTPTSAASTRSRGRCSSPPTWSSAASSPRCEAERYAGWDGPLGTAILDGDGVARRRSRRRSRPASIDPRRVSGRQERLENLVNRAIWAADPRGRRPAPAADADGLRPRDRRLDDRDQGRPRRRGRRGRRHRRRRVRVRGPATALERAGPGPVVGRRDRGDPVGPGLDRASRATTSSRSA